MNTSSWKLLSVADFRDRYREQSELVVTNTKTASELNADVWQKQTVQAFFSAYQWSPSPEVSDLDEPFGLQLSVQSYFQHFAWDAPIAKWVTPTPEPTTEATPSINIQNFSDLF